MVHCLSLGLLRLYSCPRWHLLVIDLVALQHSSLPLLLRHRWLLVALGFWDPLMDHDNPSGWSSLLVAVDFSYRHLIAVELMAAVAFMVDLVAFAQLFLRQWQLLIASLDSHCWQLMMLDLVITSYLVLLVDQNLVAAFPFSVDLVAALLQPSPLPLLLRRWWLLLVAPACWHLLVVVLIDSPCWHLLIALLMVVLVMNLVAADLVLLVDQNLLAAVAFSLDLVAAHLHSSSLHFILWPLLLRWC